MISESVVLYLGFVSSIDFMFAPYKNTIRQKDHPLGNEIKEKCNDVKQ